MDETPILHQPQPPALYIRQQIQALEAVMRELPGAIFDNALPMRHRFADGIYMREIFIPKDMLIVGKIHKYEHPNFLMQGRALVVTESGGKELLEAPMAMISPPGTKRALLTLEDCWWITVHRNPDELRDIDLLEDQIVAKDYEALEAFRVSLGLEGFI